MKSGWLALLCWMYLSYRPGRAEVLNQLQVGRWKETREIRLAIAQSHKMSLYRVSLSVIHFWLGYLEKRGWAESAIFSCESGKLYLLRGERQLAKYRLSEEGRRVRDHASQSVPHGVLQPAYA